MSRLSRLFLFAMPPSNGARLTHSIASRATRTPDQKPATSSLASVNGPSMTVRAAGEVDRAPVELSARPSAASRTPP